VDKIAVIGSSGMLGQALVNKLTAINSFKIYPFTHDKLDITDNVKSIAQKVNGCKYIYNCAAYTNVDGAESEVSTAYDVNAAGAENLAFAARETKAKLIHISTDFVFDGRDESPISCSKIKNPISVYGKSKAEGEDKIINSGCEYLIVRTSWLFGKNSKNFVNTIYHKAKEGKCLKVVCDQLGRPTYSEDLAEQLIKLVSSDASGIFHCSNNGVASWYQLACEIIKIADLQCQVQPIKTSEYQTPAARPEYSVLDITKTLSVIDNEIRTWQDALKDYMSYLKTD
jgi:dTDP-4-dehydrorhamnose reductase